MWRARKPGVSCHCFSLTQRVPGPSWLRNPWGRVHLWENIIHRPVSSAEGSSTDMFSQQIFRVPPGKADTVPKRTASPYLPHAHTDDKESVFMQLWDSDLTHQTAVGPALLERSLISCPLSWCASGPFPRLIFILYLMYYITFIDLIYYITFSFLFFLFKHMKCVPLTSFSMHNPVRLTTDTMTYSRPLECTHLPRLKPLISISSFLPPSCSGHHHFMQMLWTWLF